MTPEYFYAHSERIPESGCWVWMNALSNGYGAFTKDQIVRKAHRASYECFNGPIPKGLLVRHSCDVRSCINPAHLLVGTNADNIQDAVRRKRFIVKRKPRPSGLKYKRTAAGDAARRAGIIAWWAKRKAGK